KRWESSCLAPPPPATADQRVYDDRRLPRHIRDRPQDHAGEIAWTDLGEGESPRDMDGYAGHGSDADEGKAELTESSASERDAEAFVRKWPQLASEVESQIAEARERSRRRPNQIRRLDDPGAHREPFRERFEEAALYRRVGVDDHVGVCVRMRPERFLHQPVQ